MSFLAKLFLNGKTINVLDTDVHFYQNVHPSTFQPTLRPMGGIFTITAEATGDNHLLRLAASSDTMCEGYIRFYKYDGLSKLMDFEFFDTYVVSFRAEFEGVGSRPMTEHIVFSPGILRIGDMVFEKPWKVTDLAAKKDDKKENNNRDFNIGLELN